MDEVIMKYIVTPLVAVVGIYVVGSFIAQALGITGAVLTLFAAVGGFVFVAKFFKGN